MFSRNPFLILYYIFLATAVGILLTTGKGTVYLYLNQHHSPFLDILMRYGTWLGDGIFAVVVGVLFLTFRIRWGLLILSAYALSGLLAQFFKRLIFADSLRPAALFDGRDLHFVEGVQIHYEHSFPSGHATTAFALFFTLALLTRNIGFRMILFLPALLVAISRVYLSQHFFEDVVAGSVLGTGTVLLLYPLMMKIKAKWIDIRPYQIF